MDGRPGVQARIGPAYLIECGHVHRQSRKAVARFEQVSLNKLVEKIKT